MFRYYLHQNAPWFCVSDSRHGLASRYVLSWEISVTLNDYFCVNALHQTPETFNTEQESQDTGTAITGTLKEKGIQISMDGKGRCMGNIFIEGLWRSVKHEKVLLEEFTSVPKLLRQQANTAYI